MHLIQRPIALKLLLGVLLPAILLASPAVIQADEAPKIEVGKFSALTPGGALPPEWQPLTFKKIKSYTTYTTVKDNGTSVVKAVSKASASGLIRKIRIDPKKFPIITWRWKVANTLLKGDVTSKQGDDYPARLYITFAYDPAKINWVDKLKYKTARLLYGEYPPLNAINYIWASKAPAGSMTPNPYTERAHMIVLQSGPKRLNQWVVEERNIFQDYQKAFGTEPPFISGVAVMTDTDNTAENATAYYGDILFKKKGSRIQGVKGSSERKEIEN